jgi:hypothetical protein
MVTLGTVKEREFVLIEQGEYVLTLNEIDETEGQWGSRLVWKFLVAPTSDPTGYIVDKNGDERTVWVFTDQDVILGSIQHKLCENLTGKTYGKDAAPPDEDELLGRRVLAYITHHTPQRGKNSGKKQEQIVAGSIQPFRGPQPNKVIAPNAPARPEPTADEAERAELIARLDKMRGRAVKMETPNHREFIALDLSEADNDQLRQLTATVQAEVQDALDA